MKKIDKKTNRKIEKEKDLLRKQKEQELIQKLLFQVEEKTSSKFTDKNLDREHQKIELLGGKTITIGEIKGIISAIKRKYSPKFGEQFYDEFYRLSGKVKPQTKKNQKPHLFARWTVQAVYNRYSKDVLPALQTLNPYIGMGKRASYHHLFLSPEGLDKLETYIKDAYELMKKCSTWYEFRVKLFREFGVPFQIDAFDNPDSIK